ncbi:MAG: PD-(D/E)XK nuclease family protein [Pyrinomonadaceae bacterium]|nr:PD-(D/E)XK nuclease family protein [Pyrinomonadaceae bacterium]
MSRTLNTSLFPRFPESIPSDALLVTLSREVAAQNGVAGRALTRLARAAIRRRGLSVASAVYARHTLRRVVAGQSPGQDAAALADRIRHILDIVLRTGIDPEKLAGYGSPRIGQLGRIANAYKEELRRNGRIDSVELLWEAAHSEPERVRLVIYGHHRARKEEIHFINAAAADGSQYFLPVGDDPIFTVNSEWAKFLTENGWVIEDNTPYEPAGIGEQLAARFVAAAGSAPEVCAHAFSNIEAEVRGALSRIKELIASGADYGQTVIVVRDQENYIPVLSAVAKEYGVPIKSAYSIPLASTGLGGFLRLFFEMIDGGFPFESTARFVKHPFGPGISDEAFAAARRKHESGYEKWLDLCPDLEAVNFTEEGSFAEWTSRLKTAFKKFGTDLKAARRAREANAYRKLFETLYAFGPLATEKQISFAAFAAIANEAISDESVSFLPGNAGVAILTPEEMVGRSYDNVFVMGLAEGIFPKPPSDDPVVDFHERKALAATGIRFAEAAEVARWEDLSLYFTLAAARSNVNLSFPKSTDSGEVFPSSYLGRIGIAAATPAPHLSVVSSVEEDRVFHLCHEITSDDVMARARRQFEVEMRRESPSPYDEYDGVIGVPHDPAARHWSASQLTTIGQCAFKWFAQRSLQLQAMEEMEYGLDPAVRGLLYHKTLELAVERSKDKPDVRAAVLECLEDAFADAEIDESVGLPALPNWEQERLEQLRELRKAVAAADFIFEGSRVVGVEQRFEETWQGFPLIGYIDRVDDTPDGLIAIDYKTSGTVPKGAKDPDGKLTVDVQIPLYANVALRKLYPDGNYGNSVYYSLTKGKILREIKPDDMVKLDRLAEDIKGLLAKGSFAIDPDPAGQACTYCDFDILCRKGSRLRRKARA